MRLFVAVTDKDWFALHASSGSVEEVNFWRPSSEASFKALQPGELLLFKLHSPDNYITGGGFFTRFLQLPINMAWDVFREANGVRSLSEMRERIERYRKLKIGPVENPTIGCIMLAEPFFWPREAWIPIPSDFSLNVVQGKGYDSETGEGRKLWEAISERLREIAPDRIEQSPATLAAVDSKGFGKPQIVLPRLGQGLFRILVTDFYERRCAVTGERTLPVLDAAHIKPYEVVKKHEVWNGLLLRSDLHRLFDGGYLSVNPTDRRLLVSRRIRDEFENGKDYYQLEGRQLREPSAPWARPSTENVEFHFNAVFLR
jgi:putative restriction endonuclease